MLTNSEGEPDAPQSTGVTAPAAAPAGGSRARMLLAGLATLAALACAAGMLRRLWPFTVDDTFITLRYARHLADGIGPVWNPGPVHDEGYTSPLWTVLLALPLRLGLDGERAAKLLSVLAQCGAVAACWALARIAVRAVVARCRARRSTARGPALRARPGRRGARGLGHGNRRVRAGDRPARMEHRRCAGERRAAAPVAARGARPGHGSAPTRGQSRRAGHAHGTRRDAGARPARRVVARGAAGVGAAWRDLLRVALELLRGAAAAALLSQGSGRGPAGGSVSRGGLRGQRAARHRRAARDRAGPGAASAAPGAGGSARPAPVLRVPRAPDGLSHTLPGAGGAHPVRAGRGRPGAPRAAAGRARYPARWPSRWSPHWRWCAPSRC